MVFDFCFTLTPRRAYFNITHSHTQHCVCSFMYVRIECAFNGHIVLAGVCCACISTLTRSSQCSFTFIDRPASITPPPLFFFLRSLQILVDICNIFNVQLHGLLLLRLHSLSPFFVLCFVLFVYFYFKFFIVVIIQCSIEMKSLVNICALCNVCRCYMFSRIHSHFVRPKTNNDLTTTRAHTETHFKIVK